MHMDIGTPLARLGGADVEVLEQTTAQKSRFIQMGLVLLSTAGLATLSMTYALMDGLRTPLALAAVLGLVWGVIILNLDRLLIITMRPTSSRGRLIAMVAPRVVMAALLGIVIATPLTLRIFASEIAARMNLDNAQAAQVLAEQRRNDPRVAELEAVKADIAHYEDVLAGNVTYSSPLLAQAQADLAAAEADLATKRQAYEDANLAWRCERYGELCADGSGIPGDGARAEVAKERLDVATAELAAAQAVVDTQRAALATVQEQVRTDNAAQLAADQEEANQQLLGKRERRAELEAQLAALTDSDASIQAQNTGLLARVEALDRLGDESAAARTAHLSVAGLLFMVELLPVLVKSLSLMGPPSQYDRISDLTDRRAVDNAARRRGGDRRRQRREDAIEDDMIDREVALGRKANAHVAAEMETVLDAALEDWSDQVARSRNGGRSGIAPHRPPQPRAWPDGRPAEPTQR
jgi:Domain of unknown function (DUF4407)